MSIKVTLKNDIQLLNEELNKTEIKDVVQKEVERLLKKMVKEELELLLKTSNVKNDIADIAKDLLKKYYKDIAITSNYVVDRLKV